MGLFKQYIDNIRTTSINVKTNLAQDEGIFVKLETYIDEIIEACSHTEKYDTLEHEKNRDRMLAERLIREYRHIVADHGDIHTRLAICETNLVAVVATIPKVVKHVKEGYLDFDEYEDTVE